MAFYLSCCKAIAMVSLRRYFILAIFLYVKYVIYKFQTNLFLNLKFFNMGNLLYIIAVILVIIWAISFLGGFYTGGIIHILLVIAIIAIVFRLLNRGQAL